VPKGEAAAVTERLLTDLPVQDLTIEDPPIEDVISRAFGDQLPPDRAAGYQLDDAGTTPGEGGRAS
jgi:hypothetical protein